jgi:hypothetical protein
MSGLVRGAVSVAFTLQVKSSERHLLVNSVLTLVIFNTLLVNSLLPYFIRGLSLPDEPYEREAEAPACLVRSFTKLNSAVLKPVFGSDETVSSAPPPLDLRVFDEE